MFSLGPEQSHDDVALHLARILQQRLRSTDDAGQLEQRRIGVVLPVTPAPGAWTVVDDVCVCIPAGIVLPECAVYCYPTDWPVEELADEEGDYEETNDDRPVRAMEPLFIRRMPAWKRAIDVAGAVVGLLLLSPLFAA